MKVIFSECIINKITNMKTSNGLIKNIGLEKSLAVITALGIFLIPIIASADWVIDPPPGGLSGAFLGVILENVIVGILGLIGILGILYLVYGGIRYVTSAGSDNEIEEAKRIVTNAVYGLFFVSAAYAIVKTVVNFVG